MSTPARDTRAVCIVDDDDSVRTGLSRLMRASGFQVKAFASAYEFLHHAHDDAHLCVLLDITMPQLSGLELQAQLKERAIRLPVIAVSARDDEETRSNARQLGASFFLGKPVDDRALLDAVAWVIGNGE